MNSSLVLVFLWDLLNMEYHHKYTFISVDIHYRLDVLSSVFTQKMQRRCLQLIFVPGELSFWIRFLCVSCWPSDTGLFPHHHTWMFSLAKVKKKHSLKEEDGQKKKRRRGKPCLRKQACPSPSSQVVSLCFIVTGWMDGWMCLSSLLYSSFHSCVSLHHSLWEILRP